MSGTISSINIPDTYDNNLEILDADDEGTKEVDSEMIAITLPLCRNHHK